MFYHSRVILKPERAKESKKIAFEPDMTRDDLVSKIALPFAQKREFFCGGVVIQPSRVEEVKFNQTERNSTDLFAMIRARSISSGVISITHKWEVTHEGQDITREILEEVNTLANSRTEPEAKPRRTDIVKSDKVFVVHGHDKSAVDQTALLLHGFGLRPIILKDAPSGGKTVIEKFEAHSDVGAAIVLLTPDDVGVSMMLT
jgi:predicted nucleotide-binding protein